MSKIKTQTIEIINPENPLESKNVVVPIRGVQKVFCNEPYVLDAMKLYDSSFNMDDLDNVDQTLGGNTISTTAQNIAKSVKQEYRKKI